MGLAAATMLFLSLGAFANGPHVEFPEFIPFTFNKTGDVAVDRTGCLYVSARDGARVKIWKFSHEGVPSFFADIGTGEAYGLVVDARGDVYAAITGTDRGVYRVGHDGIPLRLPGTEQIVAANGLAFDSRGNLYVTESC